MSPIKSVLDRRHVLKLGAVAAYGLVATAADWWQHPEPAWAAEPPAVSPDVALQKLMEGNQRFVQQRTRHPNQNRARLQEVAQAQHPFATILSCADSRVPSEILFDQGLGDIFDVRVAGNIVTPEALGSLEYAVALLNSPLLMVLGHERCGAVTAAVQGEALPGSIGTFVKAIKPALARVRGQQGDTVDNAVTANVQYQMERLQKSSLLTERIRSSQLKLVGGRYDLDTGVVTIVA
ncbi:carbonic anhydrase [Leptolyngbya sp. 'hensonii']|uniref:carbonic anhydrase n=1 Tax=Leptolyngbya sp. 'hensonii' TaxID=1922337 RepID=UPI00094F4BB6|nr:carbonic anhydrase [Leptolyngbya sp. 'hensonii']OLP16184.1 carbonic anhydrase [Leptolyngbya sp. 'hensonii']